MEHRRFLKCRTFLSVPSPLAFEEPRSGEFGNFSPVSELALNLSGLTTGQSAHDDSPYGTPKRCIRVIQSQKTSSSKVQLFRPRALKKPLCGNLLDLMDSPPNPPINQSTLEKAKSPEQSKQMAKKNSAFRKFQQLSPVPPSLEFEASSPCPSKHESQQGSEYSPQISADDSWITDDDCDIVNTPKLSLDLSLTPQHASFISKPSPEVDETSQDSGVHADFSHGFQFPLTRPSSLRTDLSFSPSTLMSSPITPTSPHALSFSSPSPDLQTDDGFHDFDEDADDAPAGLGKLIHGQIIGKPEKVEKSRVVKSLITSDFSTPQRLSAVPKQVKNEQAGGKRHLFRSPSCASVLPSLLNRHGGGRLPKRVQQEDEDGVVPPMLKRRKSVMEFPEKAANKENVRPHKPILQRCHSEMLMHSQMVIDALDHAETNGEVLIGDHSKPHCLPLCHSKHQDLKGISAQTMTDLLDGKYDDVVNNYVVVDCRYPYEFDGGHIQGAVNYYRKQEIYNKFIASDEHRRPVDGDKRNILIFHCEFSSERGPKMYRFLRNKDRDTNKDNYPSLHFPEVYLLVGGYKVFWEQHKTKCSPEGAYKPMLHEGHNDDLKKYRAMSNDWPVRKLSEGEQPGKKGGFPLKKTKSATKSLFYEH